MKYHLVRIDAGPQPVWCNQPEGILVDAVGTLSPDIDLDGVLDGADNCDELPNGPAAQTIPSCVPQQDDDLDGYGNECDFDYNNNFVVDLPDVSIVLGVLGTEAPGNEDSNCNGVWDLPDISLLLDELGYAPGPSGLDCAGTVPCTAP